MSEYLTGSIGSWLLGIDTFYQQQVTPTPSAYSNVKIYGQGIADDIHIVDYVMTDTEVDNLDIAEHPVWDSHTLFLAKFDLEDLTAGNVGYLPQPLDSWKLYRRKINANKFYFIGEYPSGTTTIKDHTTRVDTNYEYNLYPIAGDYIGAPINFTFNTNYDDWYLTSEDGLQVYRLCLEMNSGAIQTNFNVSQIQTNYKYDTFVYGNRNFESGSVSLIPDESLLDYAVSQSLDFIKIFKAFIQSDDIKYLKSPKGDLWRVVTNGFTREEFIRNGAEKVEKVNFNWFEIEEINDNY